jgi:hypothetical protein
MSAESSLEELAIVPAPDEQAISSTGEAATEQCETEHLTKEQLSGASFEFSSNKKFQKLRVETTPKRHQSVATARRRSTELKKSQQGAKKESLQPETTEDATAHERAPSKTILDRLMSFLAAQLKKLEQFFLKILGNAPNESDDKAEIEEEEEELALTLREQAAKAAYLAARARDEKERKELEEIALEKSRIGNE